MIDRTRASFDLRRENTDDSRRRLVYRNVRSSPEAMWLLGPVEQPNKPIPRSITLGYVGDDGSWTWAVTPYAHALAALDSVRQRIGEDVCMAVEGT